MALLVANHRDLNTRRQIEEESHKDGEYKEIERKDDRFKEKGHKKWKYKK